MTKINPQIVIRSKIGARPELELTDEDRAGAAIRRDEQAARLARIAARNAALPPVVGSSLHCECPLNGDPCCECGKFECEAPSDEAIRHQVIG
jgi:hypothetical protein